MANITAADVNKLRQQTGAGMMDCKKALVEAEGDFEKAVEVLRKKGQKVAANRADRASSEGAVIATVNADGTKGAIVALNCETDFVGKNESFIALAKEFATLAVNSDAQTLEDFLKLPFGNITVAEKLIEPTGVIGEKIEISSMKKLSATLVSAYIHNGNKLATLVGLSAQVEGSKEAGHNVAMQVAAMNPIALDEAAVEQHVIDQEISVAIEKTKTEQVQKAVEVALKKAGINPAHVDSEEHMESNVSKGWISAEDVAKAKEIIASVSAEKAAHLPEAMIQNIAKGRLAKFFKENTLANQEYIMDSKQNVAQYVSSVNKDLKLTAFVRVTIA
ncbi:MAG: translation elongation factor Ts [Flavobacteriales bacterium]|nr:translation elongation factor Ts [Flavobacteriales bacterium]